MQVFKTVTNNKGPSIKDVHRDGGGRMVKCRHLLTGEGVKDLADICKMALSLKLFQHALQTLSMGDGY